MLAQIDEAMMAKLLQAMPGLKERAKTLIELMKSMQFLFAQRPLSMDDKAAQIIKDGGKDALNGLMPLLESADKAPETFNEVVVSNDTRRGVNIDYEISDADSGETILKGTTYAAPDSNTSLGKVSFSGNAGKPAFYVIRWTAGVTKAAGTAASATAGVASAATGAAGAGSAGAAGAESAAAGAAVVRGINHYMTGIPAPIQKPEEELKAVFRQYLKWLDIYMAEVREVLS